MTSRLDVNLTPRATPSGSDIVAMFLEREPERYTLHTRYMNEMMVRVLQTIGFDVGFRRGTGQYLFDRSGQCYLDLLSGWGVFGIGRNHPKLREALTAVLTADFVDSSRAKRKSARQRASSASCRAASGLRH